MTAKTRKDIVTGITIILGIIALFSLAYADGYREGYVPLTVECRFFVTRGDMAVYSEPFSVPVDDPDGFIHYLEDGFPAPQKQILNQNSDNFFKDKIGMGYDSAGLICRDPHAPGKLTIRIEK